MARGTQRPNRTGVPPAHGGQPLALGPVRQKLGVVHEPRRVVQQKLAPEIPPHTHAQPVHGLQPPTRGPEFLPRGGVQPVRGGEFLPRTGERLVHDPAVLRLGAPARA